MPSPRVALCEQKGGRHVTLFRPDRKFLGSKQTKNLAKESQIGVGARGVSTHTLLMRNLLRNTLKTEV